MKDNNASLPEAIQSEVFKILKTQVQGTGITEELRQHQNYLLCRRSIRMWPVVDTGGGLKSAAKVFMKEILGKEFQFINRLSIEAATKTQQLP